jgi:hypothetical protein
MGRRRRAPEAPGLTVFETRLRSNFFVLTQFPRESAMRFSRENRFTLFLELL